MFLSTLEQVVNRFNWVCYAWCLMGNHYHLLIQTPDGNLSKGMRQLNGVYTQASNRRHRRVGHLFQGRFKAILVDSDAYLLELSRYVVLNPVRAGMVKKPAGWPWSSYRASVGLEPAPPWLAVDGLLAQFAKRRIVSRNSGMPSLWKRALKRHRLGQASRGRYIWAMNGLCGACKPIFSQPKTMCKSRLPSVARLRRHWRR